MGQKYTPKDIALTLEQLVVEASNHGESGLAARLSDFLRWIKKKKPGQLVGKPQVWYFLTELVVNAEVYLDLKAQGFEGTTPTEYYWYTCLFPQWFKSQDPKQGIWKKKLMAEEFEAKDKDLISNLCAKIKSYGKGCSSFTRLILDLSMATDLLANGSLQRPLSVQLTSVSPQNLSKSPKKRNGRIHCCTGTFREVYLSALIRQPLQIKSTAPLSWILS